MTPKEKLQWLEEKYGKPRKKRGVLGSTIEIGEFLDLTRVLWAYKNNLPSILPFPYNKSALWHFSIDIIQKWNLEHPLLRNQSDEVIDFVYDLLK